MQANDVGEPTPVDLKCQCSDADPRDDKTQLVTYDCFYQRLFGNCNDTTFMFDANAELSPEVGGGGRKRARRAACTRA